MVESGAVFEVETQVRELIELFDDDDAEGLFYDSDWCPIEAHPVGKSASITYDASGRKIGDVTPRQRILLKYAPEGADSYVEGEVID